MSSHISASHWTAKEAQGFLDESVLVLHANVGVEERKVLEDMVKKLSEDTVLAPETPGPPLPSNDSR